jgi:catechol 2,3-dioxygenase
MGPVSLTVSSLVRSLDFYENAVGLKVHANDGDVARLGVGGEDLLVLVEETGATSARGSAGLFHFALLLAERTDLARWLVHAVRDTVALEGLSDHAVSEALYLRDPDSHGIEIYWDRPRDRWEGRVRQLITTQPLNTDNLVQTLGDPAQATWDGLPAATTMGHVHLCVSSVPDTDAFYIGEIGLDSMARFGSAATFLSHGGYHHHLGGNTWESAGAPYAPEGTARLLEFTIVTPTADELNARLAGDDGLVRDPSGIPVRLVTSL